MIIIMMTNLSSDLTYLLSAGWSLLCHLVSQLILTLEEDEFSCKQRLAYKLEQVHNIMQGDAQ